MRKLSLGEPAIFADSWKFAQLGSSDSISASNSDWRAGDWLCRHAARRVSRQSTNPCLNPNRSRSQSVINEKIHQFASSSHFISLSSLLPSCLAVCGGGPGHGCTRDPASRDHCCCSKIAFH